MKGDEVMIGVAATAAVFVSGFVCGRLTSRRPDPNSGLGDLWAYHRALNEAAAQVGSSVPGPATDRVVERAIAGPRRVAAEQAHRLPTSSRWVFEPTAVPRAAEVERDGTDLAFALICMAEEIRTHLERRAADRRPGERVAPLRFRDQGNSR